MKVTRARLDLLDHIASYDRHFEIEELVNWVASRSDRPVSRSTVYRTVKLLEEFGAVREVIKKDKKTIYEFVAGSPHHDHLVCLNCGKIIEFVSDEIESLQHQICNHYGFKPLNHRLEIYGLCRDCQSS
ncbi:MAG: transcriptional repressor [Aquificae bacterium]|nr:transcriptional repressor [Aquificota bacterium]